VSYRQRRWLCSERVRQRASVDWQARHTTTRIGGAQFIAVDPKHGTDGAASWSPPILHDAELLD